MPGEYDQQPVETPVAPDAPSGARLPEEPPPVEPDGDVAFVPGADVPLPPPPDDVPRCSWCSAELPDPAAITCPSCGAQLTATEPVDVPGVTAVDPALLALANRPKPERRSLASWLAGDTVEEYPLPTQAELAALAPPDPAVRREMRRLELAAMGVVVSDEAAGGEPGDAGEPGEQADARAAVAPATDAPDPTRPEPA